MIQNIHIVFLDHRHILCSSLTGPVNYSKFGRPLTGPHCIHEFQKVRVRSEAFQKSVGYLIML